MAAVEMRRSILILGQSMEVREESSGRLTFRRWVKGAGTVASEAGRSQQSAESWQPYKEGGLREGGTGWLSPRSKRGQRTPPWIWPDGGHIDDLDMGIGDDKAVQCVRGVFQVHPSGMETENLTPSIGGELETIQSRLTPTVLFLVVYVTPFMMLKTSVGITTPDAQASSGQGGPRRH